MDLRTTKKEIEESKRFNYAYKEKFKCVACGKEVEFSHIEPMERVFCDKCKKEHIESHKKLVERYAKIKLQVMHENALREMEKSCKCYMNDMLDSIDFVRQMEIESPESFFSISEIITAIILVDNDIRFKINHKILNYKIDFFIPDMHICLEVDGGFHDFRLAKDGKRDIEIRKELGEKWETISASRILAIRLSLLSMNIRRSLKPQGANLVYTRVCLFTTAISSHILSILIARFGLQDTRPVRL